MRPLTQFRTFGWRDALAVLALVISGQAWVATCDHLYLRTEDHPFLQPWNIIEGKSQAPYQYRVLASVLYAIVKKTFGTEPATADRAVLIASMVLCLLSTGLLFYRSSRSLAVTSLGELALLGCFAFGIVTKVRQEFFEVALVCGTLLTLLEVRRRTRMYALLFLICLLGSLNRETFACAIIATFAHVLWHRRTTRAAPPGLLSDVVPLAILAAVFVAVTLGIRAYFGLSPYAVQFWMIEHSIKVLKRIGAPGNVLSIGAGLLAAFVATVMAGNRNYLPFIVAYSVPLISMTFLAANLTEHRIFYSMIALMIASVTRFVRQGYQTIVAEDRAVKPTVG